MHNLSFLPVLNVWLICALIGLFYTAASFVFGELCRKSVLVLKLSTFNAQSCPHLNDEFNRLFSKLFHITHRPYKNNNKLYKLITINT
jgi:hypothetical protein